MCRICVQQHVQLFKKHFLPQANKAVCKNKKSTNKYLNRWILKLKKSDGVQETISDVCFVIWPWRRRTWRSWLLSSTTWIMALRCCRIACSASSPPTSQTERSPQRRRQRSGFSSSSTPIKRYLSQQTSKWDLSFEQKSLTVVTSAGIAHKEEA